MEQTKFLEIKEHLYAIKPLVLEMIEDKQDRPSVRYVYSEVCTRLAQLGMAISMLREEVKR